MPGPFALSLVVKGSGPERPLGGAPSSSHAGRPRDQRRAP